MVVDKRRGVNRVGEEDREEPRLKKVGEEEVLQHVDYEKHPAQRYSAKL